MPVSYTPNSEWEAPVIIGGTPATPARMNTIEEGLKTVSDAFDALEAGDTTIGAATPADGDVLTYDTVTGWGSAAPTGGGGGTSDLDDLTDVDVSTVPPTDGQSLVFDTADNLWKPATVSGGGGGATTLDGLTDVTVTSVAANDYLRYDSGTSQWVNVAGVPASHITSGTVATARLGSGTASSSTYLRGDQTYAALPASSDTAQGIVELATTAEATTGTDTARAVTAAGVKAVMDAHVALSDPHTQYLKETDAANYRDVVFSQGGTLATGAGQFRLYNRSGVTRTIQTVTAAVGTQPTGAAILVDVNISGTTIFTTQSNRPTIAVSTNEDQSGTPDVTAWTSGSYLTIDIDQIGSTVAGANLVVTVVYS
ncbi:hypothetical protein [Agromyces cerinus]|uniref:Uncharacterized protein n=1 Tax=Agromyces cerinus subsp. cerinus TaxID=232089 RepID=A0A1N6DQI4_9MICO|nr:hypothetical protein [Agromyces cerinus]SIN72923.1 hypothetical protein SAMN05443544_0587 [Agromyces cerinus subsp. cerinus]